MTPQDISDYKLRWKPGFTVRLHSDLVNEGKTWCRRHLERHQWSMSEYTNVYEHTFHFELLEDADRFRSEMPGEFIDQ